MAENEKNLIVNIKNITEKGIPGFDKNLSELLRRITQKEELEVFPGFMGKHINKDHLEILLGKNITTPDGKTKNAFECLSKEFLNEIKNNVFLGVSNKCLELITSKQWDIISKIFDNHSEQLTTKIQQRTETQNIYAIRKFIYATS